MLTSTRLHPRPDGWGVVFSGYIDIPADGLYTFTVNSDDGSRLFIAGVQVVDNDGSHSATEVAGDYRAAEEGSIRSVSSILRTPKESG